MADRFLLTSMDFRDVAERRISDENPLSVSLREVDELEAKEYLQEIQVQDPGAWDLMFGAGRSSSWTAAALSDFRELYHRLRTGTLKWVLSTGLPLHTDFQIWLNCEKLTSSKENMKPLKTVFIDKDLPGIGPIKGEASIYERTLTGGKSDQISRSNGFFVRVRKRVINLEDELFGIEAQNHSAWSRFALEIDADGLREHLLSSREGVRDSDATRSFRDELRGAFNECRNAYEDKNRQKSLDIRQLLEDRRSSWIYDPILTAVRNTANFGGESFYIDTPRAADDDDFSEWLIEFEDQIKAEPFTKLSFEQLGQNALYFVIAPMIGNS